MRTKINILAAVSLLHVIIKLILKIYFTFVETVSKFKEAFKGSLLLKLIKYVTFKNVELTYIWPLPTLINN